jgi:hypothetical protein
MLLDQAVTGRVTASGDRVTGDRVAHSASVVEAQLPGGLANAQRVADLGDRVRRRVTSTRGLPGDSAGPRSTLHAVTGLPKTGHRREGAPRQRERPGVASLRAGARAERAERGSAGRERREPSIWSPFLLALVPPLRAWQRAYQ